MNRKRIVSLLLALLMIFSMIPFSAFAESEVSDEEAAPFEETIEISEDHPEAEIIVEETEQDDLPVEATEELAEEEQPTEESEDGLTEEENTEEADIEQDNSISDNPDPTKDESEWADGEDETAELEQPADEDTDDGPQEEEQAEELPVDDPVEEQPEPSVEYADPWDEAISLFGHAYGRTKGETSVYEDADLKGNPVFIINQEDGILLATEYREQNGQKALLIWCLSEDDIITRVKRKWAA